MSAIELFHADGKSAQTWYCSECRVVHATEKRAADCHGERLCECGAKLRPHYLVCDTCSNTKRLAEDRKREFDLYTKAEKLTEWDGAVYLEGFFSEYYSSLDEFMEYYTDECGCAETPLAEDKDNPVEYVWACRNRGVMKAHSDMILEPLVESMWEDAETQDLNGVEELEAAIDAFNEANKSVTVWEPDFTKAVMIPKLAAPTRGKA